MRPKRCVRRGRALEAQRVVRVEGTDDPGDWRESGFYVSSSPKRRRALPRFTNSRNSSERPMRSKILSWNSM